MSIVTDIGKSSFVKDCLSEKDWSWSEYGWHLSEYDSPIGGSGRNGRPVGSSANRFPSSRLSRWTHSGVGTGGSVIFPLEQTVQFQVVNHVVLLSSEDSK